MRILLVEDDGDCRDSLAEFLRSLGHVVTDCGDGQEALLELQKQPFDLVFTDIQMPKLNGIELLRHVKGSTKDSESAPDIVLFTGHGDMDSAIQALRYGAKDYLTKPVDIQEVVALVKRIDELKGTKEIAVEVISEVPMAIPGLGQIGLFSKLSQKLLQQCLKFHADPELPVLIEGETGTGKEVVARLIHYGIGINSTPFIDVNCAALTPNLFETELFGYEAGAFTGGLSKGSRGKLDAAGGGSLFLDEIGELTLELQAKLLRVIQQREFYRVGGLTKQQVNARFICATNVDLRQAMLKGTFRSDLFYRLNVGHIELPPLRARTEEIIPLAKMFLHQAAAKRGKAEIGINDAAKAELLAYQWPGNIRELKNLMEWIVFNYELKVVEPKHLSRLLRNKATASCETQVRNIDNLRNLTLPTESLNLDKLEEHIITQALAMHEGNKAQTARYLGISRRTLYSRLEKLQKRT